MNYCCFETLFVFLCFQLLFSVPSFAAKLQKHVNVSNYSFILDGNDAILESTLPSLDNLLADGEVNGIPNGNDIQLSGSGFINLTLTFRTLQFEVCKSCRGASSVCFDTTENNIAEIIKCSGLPSYCKFEVKNEADYIYFGRVAVHESVFGGSCLRPTMHSGRVSVIGTSFFDSCKPKIDGVDKMIKLYVDIHSKCPIKVMNAKIHVPQVPTANPSSNSTSNDESSTASVPVWAIVIMAFVGIAAVIIIGGFGLVYFSILL
uniref:Uncharacterized protein n=1 Tax=Panagrolaimus superbus TaxID=310955 RepID=A0A914Z0F5_9BILA